MEIKEQKEKLVERLGKLVEGLDDSNDKDNAYKEIKLLQESIKRCNEIISQEKSKFEFDPIKSAEQAQKVEELNFRKEQAERQGKEKKIENILEVIKIAASIIVPVVVAVVPWAIWKHGMVQSIRYEETGNYTTAFGKGLINIRPKM